MQIVQIGESESIYSIMNGMTNRNMILMFGPANDGMGLRILFMDQKLELNTPLRFQFSTEEDPDTYLKGVLKEISLATLNRQLK